MHPRSAVRYFALLAAAVALQAQAEIQLLPAGQFAARDGRPGPGKTWEITDEEGEQLAARLNVIAAQSAMVIDYEHQSFRSEMNGQPAPAAAFVSRFEWRAGKGLFGTDTQWTERARQHIEAGEYRYISPVIAFDPDGRITGVFNAALVNTPALLGMDPVGRELSAQLAAQHATQEPTSMTLLAALIAKLGLKADSDDAAVITAVTAMQARPALPKEVAEALSIKPDADATVALSAIGSLRKAGGSATEQLTTIAALQGQVAALSAKLTGSEVDGLVDQAIKDNQIVPAQRAFWVERGRADVAMLKAFLTTAPKLNLGQQTEGDPGAGGSTTALSAQDSQVLAAMGITVDQYAKHQAAQKGA